MKENFFGYIPYSDSDYKELWETATVVVDANILLNLYRYSKKTQEEMFNSLDKLKDRLWIPYNTAVEFFSNRISTINERKSEYDSLVKALSLNKEIDKVNRVRHAILSDKKEKLLETINECAVTIKNIIVDGKNEETIDYVKNDFILNHILELYDKKIGDKISEEKLIEYKKKIDKRYENKIPPGFKDIKKDTDKKYGDAINWLETISYAKNNNKDVLYITDDVKSDWFNENTNIPRYELLNEFYCETNNKIYIYTTESFLENFNKYLENNKKIDKVVSDEINEVRLKAEDILTEDIFNGVGKIDKVLKEYSQLYGENSLLDSERDYFKRIKDIISKKNSERNLRKRELINDILDNLTPRQEKIFRLHSGIYGISYTFKEIAEQMDLPIPLVKRELERCLDLFKNYGFSYNEIISELFNEEL